MSQIAIRQNKHDMQSRNVAGKYIRLKLHPAALTEETSAAQNKVDVNHVMQVNSVIIIKRSSQM